MVSVPRNLVPNLQKNPISRPILGMVSHQEISSESFQDYVEMHAPCNDTVTRPNEPLLTQIHKDYVASQHIPKQQEIDNT